MLRFTVKAMDYETYHGSDGNHGKDQCVGSHMSPTRVILDQ